MLKSPCQSADIIVIGAGMSGMTSAAELSQAGRRVVVLDKGRHVGGRMASRRIGEAVFDYGAQFITARSDRFSESIRDWHKLGIVSEWCRGFSSHSDGHPRWRGESGMNALPLHLSQRIEVCLDTRVTSINLDGTRWSVALEDGRTISCASLMLTAPVPQSLALLDAGNFEMPGDLRTRLEAIQYERCLTVLAVLDGPSGIPPPGGMAFEEGPLAWLADNQLKGISPVPCVTLQASHAFSLAHWDLERSLAGQFLLEAAAPWLRSRVTEFQTHGWRYSKPLSVHEEACAVLHTSPHLVMAGDAFAGPKVEGAARSGWAAAEILLAHPSLS